MVWLWILFLLVVLFVLLLPRWPYMRERDIGYGPSAAVLALVIVLLVLWWLGLILVWSPWHPPAAG